MRRMMSAVLIVAAGLAGCRAFGNPLVDTQASCSAAAAGYLDAWDCIRAKVSTGQAGSMNNAQGIRYIATGDLLAEKVRSHQVTDADAKVQLAVELAKGDAEFRHQEAEAAASDPVVCNRIGATTICR